MKLPNLKKLGFHNLIYEQENLEGIVDRIDNNQSNDVFKKLTEIDIYENNLNLTDSNQKSLFERLIKNLTKNPSKISNELDTLNLLYTSFNIDTSKLIMKSFSFQILKNLNITNCIFDIDVGVDYLFEIVKRCSSLENLILEECNIMHLSCKKFSECLQSCKVLKTLSLSHNNIGKGLKYIAHALNYLNYLEKITLIKCGINDTDIKCFFNFLNCRNSYNSLKSIKLNCNYLSKISVKQIGMIYRNSTPYEIKTFSENGNITFKSNILFGLLKNNLKESKLLTCKELFKELNYNENVFLVDQNHNDDFDRNDEENDDIIDPYLFD